MSKLFILLAASMMMVSAIYSPLDARCCRPNVSIGVGVGCTEPVYVRRANPCPYPAGCYGRCTRYAGRVPPVYAYPHTVYYGPPGIIYEEIYPYPPCCGGW